MVVQEPMNRIPQRPEPGKVIETCPLCDNSGIIYEDLGGGEVERVVCQLYLTNGEWHGVPDRGTLR